MTARNHPDESESGILVYPQLPVPDGRRGEPRGARSGKRRGGGRSGLIAAVAISLAAGGAAAWFIQPAIAPDPRIGAATLRAAEAEQAAASQKQRADALDKALDTAASSRRDAEAKLAVAAGAQAELARKVAAEAGGRQAAEAAQAKLRGALDKASGTVALDGDDLRLSIAERALWKPNDDALTDHGKAVLLKLAAALKELPDRKVWIHGHTDDQPPPPAPAARPAAPPPAKKGAKPAPVAAAPVARFATNWELSAARALAVVHFLQDVARLDPTRLAALAFGQYAPVSSKDRAANRRLEIVVAAPRPPAR